MDANAEDVISPEIIDKLNSISILGDSAVKKQLSKMVELCLNTFTANTTLAKHVKKGSVPQTEFEVRFVSKNKKSVTKTQFDNVVKYLKSFGFQQKTNTFENKMRILIGDSEDSKIRVELEGLVPIQQYCRTENLESLLQMNKNTVTFTNKSDFVDENGQTYLPYYNDTYDMKYSFTKEETLEINDKAIRSVRQNWKQEAKLYRIINRLTFKDDDEALFNVDMSIVKQGRSSRKGVTMLNSGVIDAQSVYEIECELNIQTLYAQLFRLCASLTENNSDDEVRGKIVDYYNEVYALLRRNVKIVNMGLQDSKHIIQQAEKQEVGLGYSQLVFGRRETRLLTRHFCGPSSYTLQPENILPLNDIQREYDDLNSGNFVDDDAQKKQTAREAEKLAEIPNIRGHYCVTDKADGMRKLLYINDKGRLYLINTNMEIQYTGCQINTNRNLFNSVIDGEHVTHNKSGKFINHYFAFDIYYVGQRNVRSIPFTTMGSGGTSNDEQRLKIMNTFIRDLNEEWNKHNQTKMPIMVKSKKFFIAHKDFSIFECCFKILDGVRNGEFDYETDGLIFTPTLLPVGSSSLKLSGPVMKTTWANSFKWKPPKYNTIDFLVTTKKNKNGNDTIENVYYNATSGPQGSKIKQYKNIVLRCGYDEKKHGIINACLKVYNGDKLSSERKNNMDMDDSYIPAPFFPTSPYDENAHKCRIELKSDTLGNKVMVTDEGEVFEDEMIVEFAYVMDAPAGEKWRPLRVRYDKTQEYKAGYKNFGNAYHVANSNWQSIHNPISEFSITTGEQLPAPINEDVYYSELKKSDLTRAMRTFHNIVVKKSLLKVASNISIPTLLDLAVGKSGDLNKWTETNYDVVIGVDVSKDNINNPLDGACVRYLRKQQRNSHNERIPEALFFQANSSLNLRNGDAFYSDSERSYMQMLYGDKQPNETTPKLVSKLSGQFKEGFGVTACMFALHYFFRNADTLKNFLTNVAENTVKGGVFIGCCFNGEKIFDLLRNKKKGESFTIQQKGELITRITKKYDQTTFDENSLSLGMPISVYQESIGTENDEYLVNYGYLKKVMSLFGFEALDTETMTASLPMGGGKIESIGNFKNLNYLSERDNIKLGYYERELSFLNNYFVFIKKTNVDIGTIGVLDDVGMVDTMIQQSETRATEILTSQAKQRDGPQTPPTPQMPVAVAKQAVMGPQTPPTPEKETAMPAIAIEKPAKKLKMKIKRAKKPEN